ncbi:RNA polymerase sigma factor [Foetidibacter luteolus]|uniref:RNA polymerase sigma factor n=1 Tax=Foetidibacter luteolus TaxID=2608880 RepID=UPI00129A2CBF|nr:RNA polymerase sigma factor [Foetidibacter luteolus]
MGNAFNEAQFLELVQQNSGILYKVCNAYCRNANNRQDLAQEIIYQLWKSAPGYNPQQKFSTWMYRVALNVAISYYRKEKQVIKPEKVNDTHSMAEDTSAHEAEEQSRQLQQFINGLRELDRAIMLLYLDAKSYSEIAIITGITETNVATKISRIKNILKEKFSAIK